MRKEVSRMITSRPTFPPDGHPHLALTRPPLPGREVYVQRQRRVSLSAWGIAPGDWYPHDQALKGRFIQASDWAERESRFLALGFGFPRTLGRCPRFATANPSYGGLEIKRRAFGAKTQT